MRFSRSLGVSLTQQIEEVEQLESDASVDQSGLAVLEDEESGWEECLQLRSIPSSPSQQIPASSSMASSNGNFECSEDMSLFWAWREFSLDKEDE